MAILNKSLQSQIFKHAEEMYPTESCGIICKVGKIKKYFRCDNLATSKEDEFVISAEQYADIEDQGEILAIVHSHPDATTTPSIRDRAVCSVMEIPWVIVSWPDGDIRTITPERAPLEGRHFCHGTDWDCYGLVRDYYRERLAIELNRYDHDSWWWEEGKNFYLDNYEAEGFYKVEDGTIEKHDLILMQIRSKVINHAAIYVGDNLILHHMFGKLSKKDVYGGYWAEKTIMILRHKNLK